MIQAMADKAVARLGGALQKARTTEADLRACILTHQETERTLREQLKEAEQFNRELTATLEARATQECIRAEQAQQIEGLKAALHSWSEQAKEHHAARIRLEHERAAMKHELETLTIRIDEVRNLLIRVARPCQTTLVEGGNPQQGAQT